MKVALKTFALFACLGCGEAFAVKPSVWSLKNTIQISSTALSMSDSSADSKKKLTSQDIINKARKASGLPVEEEEEEIKIFGDDLLNDMKESLLLLEKRVKDGSGGLTSGEVTELAARIERISTEMRNFGKEANSATQPVQTARSSSYDTSIEAQWGGGTRIRATSSAKSEDISQDEGPEYSGTGGLGLAKGTKNTYIIPGMDEMTPEEYRAALQKSVLDAQAERRKARQHVVGNRSAHDYLSTLGYGGASKALSRGKDAPDDDKK